MPQVLPFQAFLPAPEFAPQVILPEHVRFNAQKQAIELGNNPFSFGKILSAANPEKSQEPQSVLQCKRIFDQFLAEGIYSKQAQNAYYIYQTQSQNHTQTGIVGCVQTADYNQNTIKKHENTRTERRKQLSGFLGNLGINTTPVMLSYFKNRAIDDAVFTATQATPTFSLQHQTGIQIKLWVVADAAIVATIGRAFAAMPCLYIADGHHRAAVFSDLDAPQFSVLLVPHNQLAIHPFYRLIKNYEGFDLEEIMQKIELNYHVKKCNLNQMYHQYLPNGNFLLCTRQETYQLKPKNTARTNPDSPSSALDNLDVSLLQNHILSPCLGITNPSTDPRLGFGSRNIVLPEFKHLLSRTDTACVFLCKAPSIEAVFGIADLGGIMPPKSTSFEPKVLSGLVLQQI